MNIKVYRRKKISKAFSLRKDSEENDIESESTTIMSVMSFNESKIYMKKKGSRNYINIENIGNTFCASIPIAIDEIINVFKLKEVNINPHLIAMMITNNLTNKYSYTNGLTIDKILNETVNIPIFE